MQMVIAGAFNFALSALEGLATVYMTTFQLFQLKIKFLKNWYQYPILLILLLLHVGFFGGYYFVICLGGLFDVCLSQLLVYKWQSFGFYWRIVVFLWNLIPALIVSVTFAFYGSSNSKVDLAFLKYYFSIDPRFNGLVLLQIVLTISYFVVGYLDTQTVIFANDRTSLFASHLRTVLIGFHELLAIVILKRLMTFSVLVQRGKPLNVTNNQSTNPGETSTKQG
ncbi:hypothetical protein BC833DRAFT_606739 [Globomyces pollinis-pini]|nr:hypothetical protein BC833DRAFT_606739 [Globomyces pollinis-pini]